eukprot:2683926-Amphidinium_carterae.1
MGTPQELQTLWEEAMSNGLPALDAADRILRLPWLIDLPLIPSVEEEEEELASSFAEVRVVGLHWMGGPASSADQIVVAFPAYAAGLEDAQEVNAPLYQIGCQESIEVAGVRLSVLPAFYLTRRLVECTPHEAEVLTFSPEASGAWPAASELFSYLELASTSCTGTWLYLGLPDTVQGDPDLSSTMRVLVKATDGDLMEEIYVSASEGAVTGDPRHLV